MNKLKNILKNKIVISIALAVLPILLAVFLSKGFKLTKEFILEMGVIYGVYFLIFVFYILKKFQTKISKLVDLIIKYRYIIAGIALVILVLFKVNLSSMDMWADYTAEPEVKNNILIKPRPIRSDEWLTQTPLMLGQVISENGMEIYNENIGEGNINLLMVTVPVKDILSLAKPLVWGFLFLNIEYGFSFYWILKIISLIILSIELMLKITKRNNLLSLTGGILLALAPGMMWWLSTAVVDGYIYGLAVIIMFSYYMENLNWKVWKKILIGIGMVIMIPAFALVLYPAFQVPFAFVMAIFMINDFIKHRKELKKEDYIIMGISIVLILGMLLRFVFLCYEDIKVMMSTVYPGKRTEIGGNFTISNFIAYFANIFFPYSNRIANTCEPSSYIYPFIALIILLVHYVADIFNKTKDRGNGLIIALIAIFGTYLFWELIGFNELLAKVTFMYFSPPQRTHIVVGILGTILTIIMLQKYSDKKIFTKAQGICISILITIFSCVLIKNSQYNEFFTSLKLEIVLIMIFSMTYFLIMGKKKQWCYIMCIIAIIAGATVNPITIGVDAIYNTEIAKEIREISEEDKNAIWIGENNLNGQYIIANGAKSLNGVHVYPDFEWLNIVDPDGEYNNIYNRFAHISISLGDETNFELIGQDSYKATLTLENIKDLGVKYYYTYVKCNEEKIKEFNLIPKYENNEKNQFIYQFDY